jgi:hypothetical protein
MTLTRRDVRPGMDVYALDGAYVGTVLLVRGRSEADDGASGRAAGSGAASARAAAIGEADAGSRPTGSRVNGEALGPMPTAALGNAGPGAQAARSGYATEAGGPGAAPLGRVLVLRMPLGTQLHAPRFGLRWISPDLIQTVTLERVLLRVTEDALERRGG